MPHSNGAARVSDKAVDNISSNDVEILKPAMIGLGRSTGDSRVPDLELARSPILVADILQSLVVQVDRLEHDQRFLVRSGEDLRDGGCASENTLKEWEAILAQYRQLTMAVTASSSDAVRILAIPVYEGAADACLLGGNLSFYISCQTRLLHELYNEMNCSSVSLSRRPDFVSYSFLYFGVFHVDRCELARLMRGISKDLFQHPRVQVAIAAINAVQNHDGIQFIRIYKNSDIRQRTLMNPKLSSMRGSALAQLIRAYHVLERDFALSLLGLSAESEFLVLLKTKNPALADQNSSSSSEFRFRLPATRTTVVK